MELSVATRDAEHCSICGAAFQPGEATTGGPMPYHQDFVLCCRRAGWKVCSRCGQRPAMNSACVCGPCANAQIMPSMPRYVPNHETLRRRVQAVRAKRLATPTGRAGEDHD